MLSALQIRKLTRGFNLFDMDQNGFMDRQDCERVVQATTQVMGYAPGSPEYTAYANEFLAGWDALMQLGDSDGDQRLTLAENCAAYDKLMAQPEQFNAVILGFAKTFITLWDSNQDGKVSKEEYRNYLSTVLDVTAAEASDAFRRLDLNGDGYLSHEEIFQNVKEYFGDDPEAPGNWFFGPY